jgi:hypothetical protein
MSLKSAPRFELKRVYADGTESPPELVPLSDVPADVSGDRRGFLGAGMALGAVLGLAGARTASAAGKPAR